MSTPNRAEINRANAQHSTGPKTEAGKRRSSQNALRHGFTGQLVVMPDEDFEIYQSHLESLREEYQPQSATEEILVQDLADVSWRLNRVAVIESNLLSIAYTPRDLVDCLFQQSKALANFSLHSQRLARQFERTLAQLRDLQKTRRAQEHQDREIPKSKGETRVPSENGFVFSTQQIATTQRRVASPSCVNSVTTSRAAMRQHADRLI